MSPNLDRLSKIDVCPPLCFCWSVLGNAGIARSPKIWSRPWSPWTRVCLGLLEIKSYRTNFLCTIERNGRRTTRCVPIALPYLSLSYSRIRLLLGNNAVAVKQMTSIGGGTPGALQGMHNLFCSRLLALVELSKGRHWRNCHEHPQLLFVLHSCSRWKSSSPLWKCAKVAR